MIRNFLDNLDFWNIKFWLIWLPIFLVIFVPLFMLWQKHDETKTRHQSKELAKVEKQDVQKEIQRRRSEREKTDNGLVDTHHHSSPDVAVDKTSTKSPGARDLSQKSLDPPSDILPAGHYKGMTPQQALARQQQKSELDRRFSKYLDQSSMLTDIIVGSVDNELSVMLSIVKHFSPEQIKYAKEEAKKAFSEKEAADFINLLESGIPMSLEEIGDEIQNILISNEMHSIMRQELNIEFEAIEQGYRDFYGADKYEKMKRETAARIEKRLKKENPSFLEAINR